MNVGDIPITDLVIRTWEQTLKESATRPTENLRRDFEANLKTILDQDDQLEARDRSVQSRAHNLLGNAYLDSSLVNQLFFRQRTEVDVPPYGYLQRDLIMRRMFPLVGNSIVQAAVAIIVQKVQACEYVIDGPARTAKFAKSLIDNADLGFGWEAYIAKWAQDFLTQDNGAFTEVIWDDGVEHEYINNAPTPGAKIVGFAHLDAVRCRRTGDPDHPIIYQALTGDMHKMHRTRVMVSADMVNPNERFLGRGFCAFSRVLAMAQTLVRYEKYRAEMLDDVPPLGLLILQNINKAVWDQEERGFQSKRLANEEYYFSNILKMYTADPSHPSDAKLIPFKNLWENFAERDFYDVALDLVAMGFGIDRQELAPYTVATATATQSNVLNAKGQGKGIGNVLTVVERNINQILPPSCHFKFDYHDDNQDLQRTQIRDAKAKTIVQLYVTSTKAPTNLQGATGAQAPTGQAGGASAVVAETDDDRLISKDEARRLIVKEIPEWADVIQLANPNDEVQYDDSDEEALTPADTGEPEPLSRPAVQKMCQRYGRRVKLYKSGKMTVPRGEVATVTTAEREKARLYLKSISLETGGDDSYRRRYAEDLITKAPTVFKDGDDETSPSLSTPGQRAYYFGVVQGGGGSSGDENVSPMPTLSREEYRANHPDVKAAQEDLVKANAKVAKHQQILNDYTLSKSPESACWNELGNKNVMARSVSEQAEYEMLSAHVRKLEGNLKRAKAEQSKAGYRLYSAKLGAGQEYDKKHQGWAQFTGDRPKAVSSL